MLLAVDTNVLARALVDDGSEQAVRARQCLIENDIRISDSVILETEWLLRSRFDIPAAEVNTLFAGLLSAQNAAFEDRRRLERVVLAHREGLDFADAMHLFSASDCDAMISFDSNFAKHARKIADVVPVREP